MSVNAGRWNYRAKRVRQYSEENIFVCTALKHRIRLPIEGFFFRECGIKVVIRGEIESTVVVAENYRIFLLCNSSRRGEIRQTKPNETSRCVHKFSLVNQPPKFLNCDRKCLAKNSLAAGVNVETKNVEI